MAHKVRQVLQDHKVREARKADQAHPLQVEPDLKVRLVLLDLQGHKDLPEDKVHLVLQGHKDREAHKVDQAHPLPDLQAHQDHKVFKAHLDLQVLQVLHQDHQAHQDRLDQQGFQDLTVHRDLLALQVLPVHKVLKEYKDLLDHLIFRMLVLKIKFNRSLQVNVYRLLIILPVIILPGYQQ